MAKLNQNEITIMKIKRIEKEIRDTPYHKGTEHHIGKLRAKLSKLKTKELETAARKKGSGGGGGYSVKKQGDATVVIVGPPSAGKSTLLNKLTNANSKIAPYEFTTVSVIPGMMNYQDAKIQILDIPGLIEGAEEGKGRGKEVLSVARGADLLVLLCDVEREKLLPEIKFTLERSGIRINKTPPNVSVEKKVRGGIIIHSNFKQDLDKQTIIDVAKELGIKNAEITIKEKLTMDTLIDAFAKNRVYVPAMYVLNKSDLLKAKKNSNFTLVISAEKGEGIKELKKLFWNNLGFVKVYLVRPTEKPNMNHPIIMYKDNSLLDVAEKVGSEFAEGKKRAKIWGKGAKHPGQEVSLTKKVEEGIQVRFL